MCNECDSAESREQWAENWYYEEIIVTLKSERQRKRVFEVPGNHPILMSMEKDGVENKTRVRRITFWVKVGGEENIRYRCLQAFVIGTKSGLDEEDWLTANSDIWPLALPKAEMGKILKAGGTTQWSTLRKELHAVCNYSSFGSRLFRSSLGVLAEEAIAAALETSMESFKKIAEPSKADCAKAKSEVMKTIWAIPGIDHVQDKRKVTVEYRGIEINCDAHSIEGQVDVFFAAYMRGKATELGTLIPLPGEADMFESATATAAMSKSMGDAHALRTLMATIVGSMKPPLNAEVIEDRIETCENNSNPLHLRVCVLGKERLMQYKARMVKADPEYWMDMQILKALAGSVGASSLYSKFIALLPTEAETVDLRCCWSKASELMALESYKWASSSTQGHISAAVAMLHDLMGGLTPTLPEVPPAFLREVYAQLPHFLKVRLSKDENEKRGGGSKPAVLSGLEAVRFKWEVVQNRSKKEQKLADLEELTTYSWLLADTEQGALTAKVAEIHEQLSV
eukprot:6490399-Amphidinium_carterae.1